MVAPGWISPRSEPKKWESCLNTIDEFGNDLGEDPTEGLLLPPWEQRDRYGFLNALYLTIKDVILAPRQFFHRMPSQIGLAQPLLFAIVIGVIATFVTWMWSLAGSSLQILVDDDLAETLRGPLFAFFGFLFSPIWVSILVLIKAILIHAMLVFIGGNRLGFEATCRVAAYGVATGILTLIPICGQFLAPIWSLGVMIIGLYSIHETDPWRAVLAVLLPMLVCLSVLGGGVLVFLTGLMQ